jgi:hypothetical protein
METAGPYTACSMLHDIMILRAPASGVGGAETTRCSTACARRVHWASAQSVLTCSNDTTRLTACTHCFSSQNPRSSGRVDRTNFDNRAITGVGVPSEGSNYFGQPIDLTSRQCRFLADSRL